MSLKRLFSVLLVLCMVLSLCACGNTDDKSGENNEPAQNTPEVKDPEPSDDPVEDPSENEEVSGVVYTVTVTDEGGNPVAGAMIQLCQGEMCLLPAATDANGVVSFTVAEEAAYEAKFLALPAGYEYATEEQVFHFNGATELTIVLKAVA